MFLITTADQHFWKTDEPILFLGEWCKLFSQRHIWEKLDYEVLPYHWDDREKLYQDYLYLDNLYKNVLIQLTTLLNQIHEVNHSVRYWRIIIGPWLHWFIAIMYDRYESLRVAEESGNVTLTYVTDCTVERYTPNDYNEFVQLSTSDLYNYLLYSKIIVLKNQLPYKVTHIPNSNVNNTEENCGIHVKQQMRASLKNVRSYIYTFWNKIIPEQMKETIFIRPYLPVLSQLLLQIKLRQVPTFYNLQYKMPNLANDPNLRKKIILDIGTNSFEKILSVMIPKHIPKSYIEEYKLINNNACKYFPKRPKVILTANAHWSSEIFKFWAAHSVDKNTKYILLQHGGHYGTGLWSFADEHEVMTSDVFYTWGWKNEDNSVTRPMPNGKLYKMKRIRPNKKGNILLVTMTLPRYSYWMYSVPVASSGVISYLKDQLKFIRHLSIEAQKCLLIRLFRKDYDYDQEKWFKNEFPDIQCYLGNKSMYEQLKESRLFIGTYNATAYLETLSANYPTVMFWNPDHWELNPSAKPFFNKLRNVGILHDTPESAAKMVNKIYDDPKSWWKQTKIQEVRERFCYQYARTSKNWINEWADELKKI